MSNGNPYIKNRLNKIREENQEAFDNGNFDLLLEKYNEGASGKFSDVATLVRYYNYYDQQEQDDSEKKKSTPQRSATKRKFGIHFRLWGRRHFIGYIRGE